MDELIECPHCLEMTVIDLTVCVHCNNVISDDYYEQKRDAEAAFEKKQRRQDSGYFQNTGRYKKGKR